MHFYRRSVLTSGVLPFLYWDAASAQSKALHFDVQQKVDRQHYHHKHNDNQRKASWFVGGPRRVHARHQRQLHLGKPNVVATSNENGLQLRSLKNGRLLCHLSLWKDTLYTDLNFDGTLDSVSVITGQRRLGDDDEESENRKWINELVDKVAKLQGNTSPTQEVEGESSNQATVQAHLCHLSALSGLPAKEELFAIHVCGATEAPKLAVPAPPLAVESIHGKGKDIIVAVSSGYVTRVHGTTGRRLWQVSGGARQDFPKWDDVGVVSLTRVKSSMVVEENRPILLIGENSLAIFSPRHGRQLALSSFPQISRGGFNRPHIEDFNGDGTTDVIIQTEDALWGFAIHIHAGSSFFFRVSIGLLLMLLMLAVLRNRFGPHPGRRSSDA
jgi:hypothetical protein